MKINTEILYLLLAGALVWCIPVAVVLIASIFDSPAPEPEHDSGGIVVCEKVDIESGKHYINGEDWEDESTWAT